jgi:hypothetical protein
MKVLQRKISKIIDDNKGLVFKKEKIVKQLNSAIASIKSIKESSIELTNIDKDGQFTIFVGYSTSKKPEYTILTCEVFTPKN